MLTGELFKLTWVLFRLTGVLFRLTWVDRWLADCQDPMCWHMRHQLWVSGHMRCATASGCILVMDKLQGMDHLTSLSAFMTGLALIYSSHPERLLSHQVYPQGSLLGMPLFLLLVHNLPYCCESSQMACFANDTKIFRQLVLAIILKPCRLI